MSPSRATSRAFSPCVDEEDGTYTALLSDEEPRTHTISGTINGDPITSGDASVVFVPGDASGATTTIDAAATTVSVDDGSVEVTVTVRDQFGNVRTGGGDDVVPATTGGAVSGGLTDNEDGTYSGNLTDLVAETVTITGSVNNIGISDDAEVVFTPGAADADETTIDAAPPTINVDIGTSDITVTSKDQFGNVRTAGGDTVTLDADNGDLSAVTDNVNGTYSATLEDTVTRTDTVSGTINGDPITATATVDFTPGALHHSGSARSATRSLAPDSAFTVTAYDEYNNIKTNYTGGASLSGLGTSPGCSGCSPTLAATAPPTGRSVGVGASARLRRPRL